MTRGLRWKGAVGGIRVQDVGRLFASVARWTESRALPFTPVAPVLGFVAVPSLSVAVMVAIVLAYLASAEFAKGWFYRRASF